MTLKEMLQEDLEDAANRLGTDLDLSKNLECDYAGEDWMEAGWDDEALIAHEAGIAVGLRRALERLQGIRDFRWEELNDCKQCEALRKDELAVHDKYELDVAHLQDLRAHCLRKDQVGSDSARKEAT